MAAHQSQQSGEFPLLADTHLGELTAVSRLLQLRRLAIRDAHDDVLQRLLLVRRLQGDVTGRTDRPPFKSWGASPAPSLQGSSDEDAGKREPEKAWKSC